MIVQYNLVDISESKKRRIIRALKWDDTALTSLYSSKANFINALMFKISEDEGSPMNISKIELCFHFVQVENEIWILPDISHSV